MQPVVIRRMLKLSIEPLVSGCGQITQCSLKEIGAGHEYSPQEAIRDLAQEIGFKMYSLSENELQYMNINFLYMCQECVHSDRAFSASAVIWVFCVCYLLGHWLVCFASSAYFCGVTRQGEECLSLPP